MHKMIISNPTALIFGSLCLDSKSINVCCHVYNFDFVYENINSFLLNDHIPQTHFGYFIQIFRIFHAYWLL